MASGDCITQMTVHAHPALFRLFNVGVWPLAGQTDGWMNAYNMLCDLVQIIVIGL
jgi:hypothetical protein